MFSERYFNRRKKRNTWTEKPTPELFWGNPNGQFFFKARDFSRHLSKGNPVKILEPGCGSSAATQMNLETLAKDPGRVFFSPWPLNPLKSDCPELGVDGG